MICRAGAGPAPLPHKLLTAENLAEAIQYCYAPGAQTAARALGAQIRAENGVERGVASFHRHLPLSNMR
jgi:hypothetical protein